jgi:ligand-binding sensor domain-containing protein
VRAIDALAVATVFLLTPRLAVAAPAVAMTDLDDANACLPLPDGGLAMATGGGLVVVDRSGEAHVLTALDGLPGTRAYALALDRAGDGALWVGTEGGVARVSPGPTPTITRSLAMADLAVRALWPVPGGVYLGTWGSGLMHFAPGNGGTNGAAVVVAGPVAGTHVAALAEHGGALYVAYADGPIAVLEGGVLRQVATGPSHGQALASVEGQGGQTLLVGDLEGLFGVGGGASAISTVDARAIASSPAGLLVGTYGAGLLSGPSPGALREEEGVPRFVRGVAAVGSRRCAATPEGVFVDESDHAWRRVSLAGRAGAAGPGGPPSNDVSALAASGGRMAVGTFDHGVAIYEHGAFAIVAGLAANEAVEAATWQGRGAHAVLLLGTARGLVRVAPDGTTTRLGTRDGLPSARVRSLLVLADDRVLVGTDEGAAFVDGDRIAPIAGPRARGNETHKGRGPRALASPMHATWALAASNDGTLWVGTTAGLYYGRGGRYRRASVATGELTDDWVTALAVRGADVFVGTYAGGVTHLRMHDGTLSAADASHVSRRSHPSGVSINPDGLALIGGELLAATMEGLLVRPAGDDDATWQLRADAAPGRDVTAVRLADGALWVASRRGIGVSRTAGAGRNP